MTWCSIKDKALIKEVFNLMDTDSDGYLDYYETKAAMKTLGLAVKKSFLVGTMRIYDKCGANRIGFDDFYFVVSEQVSNLKPMDKIKHAFQCFTTESACEKITLETLQKINQKLACNLTEQEMLHMIHQFDLNKDGSIDEDEFAAIIAELEH